MVIITEEVIIHSTRKEKKVVEKGKNERQKRKLKKQRKTKEESLDIRKGEKWKIGKKGRSGLKPASV